MLDCRRLIALVLVALWLPATLHCAIEAAGVELAAHGDPHGSTSCKDVCTDDSCPSVEGVSLTKTSATLRVIPPAFWPTGTSILDLLTPPLAMALRDLVFFYPGDPPEIQRVFRTWQFDRRAALPARAPALPA